jgi:hypothetical protein
MPESCEEDVKSMRRDYGGISIQPRKMGLVTAKLACAGRPHGAGVRIMLD